ncbi:PhnD/SsuA/transferrin family substrate-binding protein [Paenarthrobacter sp. PH39-S1]|uniref:Rv1680 family SBP-like protein n=1 Tax=Paenarthrobacter sp. PH39-S1 TaxID=3046204 RepID=UPI0024BB71A3|nr:PhnD/SsuA/transferrin family substrate-binding protein [Paenarthrobacter sp. PH39-S1]MDJ0356800.1 PhnD/SsuA/transferrin family substrate-binding protein [Paenarthrobacter sp. PH39-S1]
MSAPLIVGSVAYTPNVVTIWEGIRDYFAGSPAEMDFVLFSNYGRQVDALLQGTIDLAWNTNLAWVRTVAQTKGACRALAMRDTDTVFRTMFVARAGSGLGGLEDLTGRRLALGSRDSAQAAILPVHFLTRAGLTPGEVDFLRIDSDVGKHGDTGRSELDALRAVLDDRADAAAIGINTWEAIGRDELMPGALELFWESPVYSHCNFTALPALSEERATPWVEHLLGMDWDNPAHRPILEMEGLRRWVVPRLEGYASLFEAVREQQIGSRW